MSLALDVDRSPTRPVVVAGGDTRPVFVDESGRRARWYRRLLAICSVIAVVFVLTVTVLGVAFAGSAGSGSWTAAGPTAAVTAPAQPGTGS